MSFVKTISVLTVSGAIIAGTAYAGGHTGNPAVTARQAHMQLYSHNIGILAGMARGTADYDADAAVAAAGNLARLAAIDETSYWPAGTDSDTLGDETRALPAIWEKFPDILTELEALRTAAMKLEATAGDGLEAVQAGLGPIGAACGSCHDAYRKPRS